MADQQRRQAELDEEAMRAELELAQAFVELTKAMSNRGSRAGGSVAGSSQRGDRGQASQIALQPDPLTGSMVPLTRDVLLQHELLTFVSENNETLHVHGNTQTFVVHTPGTSHAQQHTHDAPPPAGTREGLSAHRGVNGGEESEQVQPKGSPAIPRTWAPTLQPPRTLPPKGYQRLRRKSNLLAPRRSLLPPSRGSRHTSDPLAVVPQTPVKPKKGE